MIAATDWHAVAEQHHDDGAGGCSCGTAECRIQKYAERQCRDAEQALLPGSPPQQRVFTSVFQHGEVNR